MLCLSFYEWRGIYPGEQMILAPFLEKSSFDRAAVRFADDLFAQKHAKADVLLTPVLGPVRWSPPRWHRDKKKHINTWDRLRINCRLIAY